MVSFRVRIDIEVQQTNSRAHVSDAGSGSRIRLQVDRAGLTPQAPSTTIRSMARPMLPIVVTLALALSPAAVAAQSNDLAARSRQASQAMQDGRFDAAAAIYRELLKALPNEAGLHMNLGMALAMGGHEADAIAPLERAVRLQPSLLPAQLFLGSTFLALGKPQPAIAPLERVVTAQPADPKSRDLLGQALLASNRPAAAAAQFMKLTEIAPRDPHAWHGLAQAWNAIVQSTLASFDQGREEENWRTLLLADALRDDGRFGPAFTVYRRVVDRLPGTRAVHEGLAAIYEQTGHADWAARERARADAVAVDCKATPAECSFAAKRYQQVMQDSANRADPLSRYWRVRAAAALTKAAFAKLDALPDSRERREMRAQLARARGQHLESVAEIKAALGLAPDDPALLGELALSLHLARDYEQALAIEQKLLARAPDDPAVLALYGQSLLELQRVDEAIPPLEKATKLAADEVEARAALGRAYVQKGSMAAAIPLLEPALAGDEDGTLHFQLARAYQGLGQPEKAKPLLERYQSLQRARAERDAASTDAILPPDKERP
jgi:predicted Zn-dependent protease